MHIKCFLLLFDNPSSVENHFFYQTECFPGFLCSPVFSCVFLCFLINYIVHVGSCVVLCALLFHLFPFGFHCHCFIWVQLFQKQSWDCDFNNSWFKAPFEQYAQKLYLLSFENPPYRKAFLLLDRMLSWIPWFSCVLLCFPVFSY